MKPLLDALGKAIKALQPILWFVVVVAAIVCVFLLMYANGKTVLTTGCPTPLATTPATTPTTPPVTSPATTPDPLGICTLWTGSMQWIGLIAIVSIIMIVIGAALWVWQKLKPILFPPEGNRWIGWIAIMMIVISVALWAWLILKQILLPPKGNQWIELIAVLLILIGGALWAWQKQMQLRQSKDDTSQK